MVYLFPTYVAYETKFPSSHRLNLVTFFGENDALEYMNGKVKEQGYEYIVKKFEMPLHFILSELNLKTNSLKKI